MSIEKKIISKSQKLAIETEGKNILISAAAGSGKTFVLIERCIHLVVKKRVPVKKLLVVTFTKDAANEMKKRLFEALERIENKDDFIKEQLNDVLSSNISTIHSFCARMLKTYFFEIGLDPSFVLIDEVETASLREKSYQKLVERAFEKNDNAFFELLDIFSQNRKDKHFKEVIFKFYDFLKTQVDAEGWFFDTLSKNYTTDLDNNKAVKFLLDSFDEEAIEFLETLDETDISCLGYDSMRKIIVSLKNDINLFLKKGIDAKMFALRQRPVGLRMPSEKTVEDQNLYTAVKNLKEEIKKFFDRFKKTLSFIGDEDFENRINVCKSRVISLYQYVKLFEDIFSEMKEDKLALDFSDLEYKMIELLRIEHVRQSVRDSFDFVFVDEYQDTNYVQEEILKRVSGEDNLYMVGDVKQSIYKFRESEPQIFIEKYSSFRRGDSKNSVAIDLHDNFRSHKNILGFTNHIFKHIMTPKFGRVDYLKSAMLISKNDTLNGFSSINPSVTVEIIKRESHPKFEISENLQPYSVKNHKDIFEVDADTGSVEGVVVAQTIENFKGRLFFDMASKKMRRIGFEDITILTASRDRHLEDVLAELQKAGIPFSSDVSEDIFEDYSMSVIKAFLEILNNPYQDIPLVTLMKSEVVGFTSLELAEIRIANRSEKFFYEAVDAALVRDNIPGGIREKILRMKNLIQRFVNKSKYLEVDNLILEFLKETNFECFLLARDEGEKSLGKLHKFLSSLNGKTYNISLSKFIDNISENTIKFENVGDINCVKVTSIHKSKGLEFPVVILVGAGRNLFRNESLDLVLSREFGCGMNFYDTLARTKSSTFIKNAGILERNIGLLEERARLLYVALTRAVNHLVVIGTEVGDRPVLKNPKNAKTFLDWIGCAVEDKRRGLLDEGIDFEVVYRNFEDIQISSRETNVPEVVFGRADDEVVSNIEGVFNFVYPYKEFETKISKTSVSDILRVDAEDRVYIQSEFQGEAEASLRGTAFHKVMQNIDFSISNRIDIEKFVSKLHREGILTDDEVSFVDIDAVFCLLSSSEFRNIISNAQIFREREFVSLENTSLCEDDCTLVQGVVDLIAIKNGNITLVDYKTNSLNRDEYFVSRYKRQIDLYTYAVRESFGMNVSKRFIYSTRLCKFIEV